MKIIIDNKIPFISGRIERALPEAEVVYAAPGSINTDTVADADALIVRTRTRCDKALLAKSNVRLVVTATIGTDHIDMQWCAGNGITVCNAAGCNAPGVAQYVWSALLRKGFDPTRHTIGVVGLGHVGSIVANWGRRLGARVTVCDPPREKAGFTDTEYLPLHDLIAGADAVTLHTPLTLKGENPTFHLIGERELNLLRPGAVLVNTSRGPVADNRAWEQHLLKGTSQAVVDVWEGEPLINPGLLAKATVATPHIAGYSFEGKQRATRMALEAFERYFGVRIPKDGLCGDYLSPGEGLSADTMRKSILDSYDPLADDARLRSCPEDFERLRSDYDYRHEPAFTHIPTL